MRIAMLCVHTSPLAPLGGKKTGGMNVYVRELAAELGRQGMRVDIFTRRGSPGDPEIDTALGENVRVVYVPCGPLRVLDPDEVYPHLSQFAAGVIAFTTRHNAVYDVIYSHYWLSGWVAHKLNEVWGTPFVQMFHTLGYMKNRIASNSTPLPLGDPRTTVETQITGWAARIVAATPAEQSQLMWLYRADRRKIAVVPPGVNMQRFNPLPHAQAKAALGLAPDERLLLFVGRLEPLKAVDTILYALAHLNTEAHNLLDGVQLAIIGGDLGNPQDKELARLRALTADLCLEHVVRFLGAKDQPALREYYAAATALIMPSDYESFGMVALEAMASGTPVIASEVGGLAFLVRDGETGFLVPVREPVALANRIATLLTDPARRERMSRSASALARTYAWECIAEQLLGLFGEVIAGKRPRRPSLRPHV